MKKLYKFFWEINISPDKISGDLPKDIAKDLKKNAIVVLGNY